MLHVVAFKLMYNIPIFAFDSLQNVLKNKTNLEKEQWWEFGLFSQTICNLMHPSPLIGSHPQQLFIGNGSTSWMYGRFDGLRLILRLLVPNYFLFFLCYCYSKKLFNLRPPLLTGVLFFSCACFLFSPSLDFNNSRSVAKGNWFQRPRLWKRNLPVDRKNVAVDNSKKKFNLDDEFWQGTRRQGREKGKR